MSGDSASGSPRWVRAQRAAVLRGRIAAMLAALVLVGALIEGIARYPRLPTQILVLRGQAKAPWQRVAKNPWDVFGLLVLGAAFLAIVVYSAREERASAGRRWQQLRALSAEARAFVLAPVQEATYYAGAVIAVTMALVQRGMWQAWGQQRTYGAGVLVAGVLLTLALIAAGALRTRARSRRLGRMSFHE